jgi:integrase
LQRAQGGDTVVTSCCDYNINDIPNLRLRSDPNQMKKMLTNTALGALRAPDVLWDTLVPGLHVRARGLSKAYFLYFRTKAGVERRPKLGDTTVLSIAQARDNARAMLAAVAEGRDPMAERTKAKSEPTMDEAWAEVEANVYNCGKAWDREAKRLYELHASPKIGGVRVRALSVTEVRAMHVGMKATPFEANRTLAVVSKICSYGEGGGVEWRAPGSNPCQAVARYPEPKRTRFAKPFELPKLRALLDREAETPARRPAVAFIWLLAFSGARPSEIERALPSMLERVDVKDVGRCGVLRIPEGKTGHRDVFLPPQAMRVIDTLPAAGLPLRDRHRRVQAMTITGLRMPRALWSRVRAEAGCPDLWARDWRRTFATVGFSGGENKHTVSDLLGHASVQTTNIYALLMQDPALAASARIATRMEALLATPLPEFMT